MGRLITISEQRHSVDERDVLMEVYSLPAAVNVRLEEKVNY
jgi:hypothetical protein